MLTIVYSSMFTYVCQYLLMFTYVYHRLLVFTYVTNVYSAC